LERKSKKHLKKTKKELINRASIEKDKSENKNAVEASNSAEEK